MEKQTKNGIWGLALIGVGAGLTAAGIALVVPVCASWSRGKLGQVYEKSRKTVISGFEDAVDALGNVASKAQQPLADAARAAKQSTALAAGAIESAAHYIKEHVQ